MSLPSFYSNYIPLTASTHELVSNQTPWHLSLIVHQVSREQHRLELEQRELCQGIRASQEQDLLECALERSLSIARGIASRESAEDIELRTAIQESLVTQEHAQVDAVREESELEQALKKSNVTSASNISTTDLSPPPYKPPTSLAPPPPPVLDGCDGHDSAVRDLEESIARANGFDGATTSTAAAMRSARIPSNHDLPRTESLKACYAAQHHFVLTQLTRASIFEADSESGDEDHAASSPSRSTSRFV